MLIQIAPDIFRYAALLYYERSNQFLAFAQAMVEGHQGIDYEEALQTLKVAYAALKCLRRTIVFGFQAFETVEEPAVGVFFFLMCFGDCRQDGGNSLGGFDIERDCSKHSLNTCKSSYKPVCYA